MDINEQHIKSLINQKKLIDRSLDVQKNKFIKEIREGLGEKIKQDINKPKENIKEEKQTKGLFRKLTQWILKLSKK